jgi:lipopolysaccharide transport system permease protein
MLKNITVINNKSSYFALNLKEVKEYRDLLFLLVKRDFVSFYKQTIFGPLWFFAQPIFTTIVYTFVFGNIANLSDAGIPQSLFYLSGVILWNFFVDCLVKTSTVFRDNASLFSKVYFPRLILPLSILLSNLVKFSIQFLLFILLLIYFVLFEELQISFSFILLYIPFLIVLISLLGLGLGLLITAYTIKYRDLTYLISFATQLLMYTSTIIYSFNNVPGVLARFVFFNPMTGIIEAFRFLIFKNGNLDYSLITYSLSVALASFTLGILVFNKNQKSFIDSI